MLTFQRTWCLVVAVSSLSLYSCHKKNAATTSSNPPPAAIESSAEALKAGAQLFADNCAGCHKSGGGNYGTPDLTTIHMSQAAIERVITKGDGRMPAFGNRLSVTQIQQTAAYVASLHGHQH